MVILPSEQVIPFFADGRSLEHIEWVWDEDCLPFIELAPSLAACIQDKQYAPSLRRLQIGQAAMDLGYRGVHSGRAVPSVPVEC